jgi:hypothetical protein
LTKKLPSQATLRNPESLTYGEAWIWLARCALMDYCSRKISQAGAKAILDFVDINTNYDLTPLYQALITEQPNVVKRAPPKN